MRREEQDEREQKHVGFQEDQNIGKIMKEVQLSDFYHMMFLKPFQCILQQSPIKGDLPQGLKIVNRINDLQFQAKPIKSILSFEQFSKLTELERKDLENKHGQTEKQKKNYKTYKSYCIQNNGDNLLCQMKIGSAVEIAICVCMYNEDKVMLNNTLMGIGQNIAQLSKEGIDPDKIVVIILQDGIQKMDKSVFDFFEVLQAESGIRFGSQKQRKLQSVIEQIDQIDQNRKKYSYEDEDTILNLNFFLFSQEDEEKRNRLRFTNIKKQYDQVKALYVQVQKLKNDKTVTHQDLPLKVLNIFKEQCRKYVLGDAAGSDNSEATLNKCFNEVGANIHKSRPLVQNALTKASDYCKQYIQSRLQMSHVSFFRTSQFFPDDSGFSTDQISQLKAQNSSKLIKISKLYEEKRESENTEQEKQSLMQKIEQKVAVKMNIFFVIKYKNAQKLSSHNWFFNGFCKEFSKLQRVGQVQNKQNSPKYTILLDVGLRPESSALCKMYYALENHKQEIGGVCGYMGLKLERTGDDHSKLKQNLDVFTNFFLTFVDIQRAQQLQYHFAHLIDKGFESIFKFIHVLPGAFSGYNMKAIWGNDNTENADELLKNYFKSIDEKVKEKKFEKVNLSVWKILARILLPDFIVKKCIEPSYKDKETYEHLMYESNVYLAEDRILCMGIHKNKFDLMFLPDAYSFVDPMKDLPSLMGQRKRWINGSYFAFEKVSREFSEMSCCQVLNIQIWYLTLMNMLAFIAPGFFLFSISVAMQAFKADVLVHFFKGSLAQDSPIYDAFVYSVNFIYAMLIFGLVYFSINLTNRNQKFVRFVYGVSTVLGVMSLIMLVILTVDLVRGLGRGSSYLISNNSPTFIDQIPGGQSTVDLIRYVVIGIMGLYGLPLLLYSICFCNIRVIFEVISGALSFAFYTPTYLIILNIYALCRMDDLSWGTKGLDAGSDKDNSVLEVWKIIKTIHVAKLLFWNVIVAGLLIHFGSNYLIRFYLTFVLMIIIASTMLFKVICGILYYFYYLITIKNKKKIKTSQVEEQTINSNKYLNADSTPKENPALYRTLKSKINNDPSLVDELKKQIATNFEILKSETGDNKTSIMAMQLIGQFKKTRTFRNQDKKAVGSMISGIVSINRQRVYKEKQATRHYQRKIIHSPRPNSKFLKNKQEDSDSATKSLENAHFLKNTQSSVQKNVKNQQRNNSPKAGIAQKKQKQDFHILKKK